MKFKRVLCTILILLISLTGCSRPADRTEPSEYKPPEPKSVTVTDANGRTVTTSADNAGIISVGYEATSLLIALGAKGRITGAEMQKDSLALITKSYPEIENLPAVTDENGNLLTDKIKEQNPGLVILTGDYAQYIPELEAAGLTAAVVRFETIEQVKSSVELIGSLSNTESAAQKLSSFYDSALTRIKTLTSTEAEKTVSVYNNDAVLTELMSYLNCRVVQDGEYVIAKAADNSEGALSAPNTIEPWDEPSVSLILGLYWYAHQLFPQSISKNEMAQKAINFYAEFFGVTFTAAELGITL